MRTLTHDLLVPVLEHSRSQHTLVDFVVFESLVCFKDSPPHD
jgi:hypothetical protein